MLGDKKGDNEGWSDRAVMGGILMYCWFGFGPVVYYCVGSIKCS